MAAIALQSFLASGLFRKLRSRLLMPCSAVLLPERFRVVLRLRRQMNLHSPMERKAL